MENITKENLILIDGGFNISGTIVNAFTGVFKTVYRMGQSFGSAIRRLYKNDLCPL